MILFCPRCQCEQLHADTHQGRVGRPGKWVICLICKLPWLYIRPPGPKEPGYKPEVTSNYE